MAKIRNPNRGQAVWMALDGEPHLRYFVEFYNTGCRVAFEPDLQAVYFDSVCLFYESKADVLAAFLHARLESIEREIKEARGLLCALLNCEGNNESR